MFTRQTLSLVALVVASQFAIVTAPVTAQAQEEKAPQVVIPVSGYDLSSSAGMDMMKERIRSAARHMCSETAGVGLIQSQAERACLSKAVADAYKQLDTMHEHHQSVAQTAEDNTIAVAQNPTR